MALCCLMKYLIISGVVEAFLFSTMMMKSRNLESAGPPVSHRNERQCDSASAVRGFNDLARSLKLAGPPVSHRNERECDSAWATRGFSNLARCL